MEWIEKKPIRKYIKTYVAVMDSIMITVNLRKFEYERLNEQIWDVIMSENGRTNIGRGQVNIGRVKDIKPEKIFPQAIHMMREHLNSKVDYHRTNYENWKSRAKLFERMTA